MQTNNELLDFLRFYTPLLALLIALVGSWTYFYVIPTAEWNNQIMNCQLDIDDLSYEGYEYCVELHNQ